MPRLFAKPLTVMSHSPVFVACLCAEWCGVCRDYRSVFEQVRARVPEARFVWVDVEDQSDLVDPVEVDDFPTLLVAEGNLVRFFGPMIPRADPLERMVREYLGPTQSHGTAADTRAAKPETDALLKRLLSLTA